MVYSQLGVFLKYELHASEDKIALIDGLAELLSNLARVLSGTISDFLHNRKFMLILGSAAIAFIRPFFAICTSISGLFVVLSADRIISGLIVSPRDALISDLSGKRTLNRAYGASKIAKTIGSFCGIFFAIFILNISTANYFLLYIIASIPAAISFILATRISEYQNIRDNTEKRKFRISEVFYLNKKFWQFICFVFLFELAHFSDSLLTIRASNFCSVTEATYTAIFISLGQIVCTYPISHFADKFSFNRMIFLCIAMTILANLLMLFACDQYLVFLAAFFWGGQMSSIAALALSMITINVDFNKKGIAIGIYYIAVGLGYFISGSIAGFLWKNLNCNFVFLYSIAICILSASLYRKLCTYNETLKS